MQLKVYDCGSSCYCMISLLQGWNQFWLKCWKQYLVFNIAVTENDMSPVKITTCSSEKHMRCWTSCPKHVVIATTTLSQGINKNRHPMS